MKSQCGHSTRGTVRTEEGEAGGTGWIAERTALARKETSAPAEDGAVMLCPDLGVTCKRLSLVNEWSVDAGVGWGCGKVAGVETCHPGDG